MIHWSKFVSLLGYVPFHSTVNTKGNKRMAEGLHLTFYYFQGFGYLVTHLNFPRRQTSSYLWAKIKRVYLNVMKVKKDK